MHLDRPNRSARGEYTLDLGQRSLDSALVFVCQPAAEFREASIVYLCKTWTNRFFLIISLWDEHLLLGKYQTRKNTSPAKYFPLDDAGGRVLPYAAQPQVLVRCCLLLAANFKSSEP